MDMIMLDDVLYYVVFNPCVMAWRTTAPMTHKTLNSITLSAIPTLLCVLCL